MFDDRKATGNPGRITCCGAQGESQQQFPDEAPVAHYQEIVVALNQTIRIMAEIDEVIEAHGGWPDAFQTGSEADEARRGAG